MTGYRHILRIQRLEKEANELGFQFGNPLNGRYNNEWGDMISVFPKDDCLPMYSRDAELFTGTLEEFEIWMRGIEWARMYDERIKLSNQIKRERKEQDLKNKQMVSRLKEEDLELLKK